MGAAFLYVVDQHLVNESLGVYLGMHATWYVADNHMIAKHFLFVMHIQVYNLPKGNYPENSTRKNAPFSRSTFEPRPKPPYSSLEGGSKGLWRKPKCGGRKPA